MTIISPLNNSPDVTLLTKLQVKSIVDSWHKRFGFDISDEFCLEEEIALFRCDFTDLMFYSPSCIAASDKIYEELQKCDWYYIPNKWEHKVALNDIPQSANVLEVGCGRGEFLNMLIQHGCANAFGIELNRNAVSEAQSSNLQVMNLPLEELVKIYSESFDVVCSFQVLEHVPDPKSFLSDCIKLLKPKGKLILCVPNSAGFIRLSANNLLNQPPHHMTLWSVTTFEKLQSLFPITILSIKYEPVADYHFDWFVDTQVKRLPNIKYFTSLLKIVIKHFIAPLIYLLNIHYLFRGHSIYVCYEKNENSSY